MRVQNGENKHTCFTEGTKTKIWHWSQTLWRAWLLTRWNWWVNNISSASDIAWMCSGNGKLSIVTGRQNRWRKLIYSIDKLGALYISFFFFLFLVGLGFLAFFFFFFFNGSTGIWIQGLMLARQVLLPLDPLGQPHGIGIWTKGFMLTKQAIYCLSTPLALCKRLLNIRLEICIYRQW
jgi:hypothetical protein